MNKNRMKWICAMLVSAIVMNTLPAAAEASAGDTTHMGEGAESGTGSAEDNKTENSTDNKAENSTDNNTENGTDNKTENSTDDNTENSTEDKTENSTDDKTENGTDNNTENSTDDNKDNNTDNSTEGTETPETDDGKSSEDNMEDSVSENSDNAETMLIPIKEDTGLRIEVPTELPFVIDPFEITGRGQVYSQDFQIINRSAERVKVTLTEIKYSFKNNKDFRAVSALEDIDDTSDKKDIFLTLDIEETGETLAITDQSPLKNYSFLLASGNGDGEESGESDRITFSIGGSVNPSPRSEWYRNDVRIEILYTFEPASAETTESSISDDSFESITAPEEDNETETQEDMQETETESEESMQETESQEDKETETQESVPSDAVKDSTEEKTVVIAAVSWHTEEIYERLKYLEDRNIQIIKLKEIVPQII